MLQKTITLWKFFHYLTKYSDKVILYVNKPQNMLTLLHIISKNES